ncbi:uncharacterized protein [Dysidea avara]|uniref:uncharacterized protein isoform X2 n=1 Tax=Dysidea avara TaxID=196820 RepID=UPI00331A6A8E
MMSFGGSKQSSKSFKHQKHPGEHERRRSEEADIGAKGAIVWRDSDSTILSKMFEMIKELKEEVNAMKFEIREIKSALQPNPGPGMVTSAKEARLEDSHSFVTTILYDIWDGITSFFHVTSNHKQTDPQKDAEIADLKIRLAAATEMLNRYTVQAVENLESKGSFTQISEPYQEAISSIDQLWRTEYMYTMKEIKDYFPKYNFQTGLKHPEEFLQVILTSALQDTFDYARSRIISLLTARFEADLSRHQRKERFEDQQVQDIISQVYDQMKTHGIKVRDNNMDVVNGYFEAIFNEKPGKETGWLQTFKRYKFIQIKLLESEQSETSEKKIFLTESSQHFLNSLGRYTNAVMMTVKSTSTYHASGNATSKAIWKLLCLPNPILLQSSDFQSCEKTLTCYEEDKHQYISGMIRQPIHNQVCAFARPVVINTAEGSVISKAVVIVK